MSKKDAYERKLQAQLDEWSAEIDRLKAKAEGASADAQIRYHKEIEGLQQQKEAANRKLSELRDASEGAWEDMKSGLDEAWKSLADSVKAASARFR